MFIALLVGGGWARFCIDAVSAASASRDGMASLEDVSKTEGLLTTGGGVEAESQNADAPEVAPTSPKRKTVLATLGRILFAAVIALVVGFAAKEARNFPRMQLLKE